MWRPGSSPIVLPAKSRLAGLRSGTGPHDHPLVLPDLDPVPTVGRGKGAETPPSSANTPLYGRLLWAPAGVGDGRGYPARVHNNVILSALICHSERQPKNL